MGKNAYLHDDALNILERVQGYRIVNNRKEQGRFEYFIVEDQKGEQIPISILGRSHKEEHRYPLGFQTKLFSHVRIFMIYLENEPYYYLIPKEILIDKFYEGLPNPSVKGNGQWICNLQADRHQLETYGYNRYQIKSFSYHIPTIV